MRAFSSSSASRPFSSSATPADATAAAQRALQSRQDQKDQEDQQEAKGKSREDNKKSAAPAAPGPGRREPQSRMPQQHLRKPGLEADMELKPRFEATH